MAYRVYYGDTLIYEAGNDELPMHNASLSQAADGVAKFKFTLPPTHPAVDTITLRDLTNLIEVFFDNTQLFSGFVSSKTTTLWLETEFNCVSELQLLDELLVRYKPTYKKAQYVLAELLSMWNNLTTHTYQFYEGKIEFAVDPQSKANQVGYENPDDGTPIIDAETTSPKSVLAILRDAIVSPYGAFIRMRKDAHGTRLIGIFPNAPDTSTQVVNLGENLLDYNYTETDEGMYNACIPIGGSLDQRTMPEIYNVNTNIVVAAAASAGDRTISLRTTSGTAYLHGGGSLIISRKYGHALEGNVGVYLTTEPRTVTLSPPLSANVAANARCYEASFSLYQYDDTATLLGFDSIADTWSWDFNVMYNRPSVRAHGMKMMTFQDNEIRDAHALFNKAKAMLIPRLDFKRSLTISALDMAFYLTGYVHLQAGQQLRVVSEPHGLDTIMYVRTADINLDDPSQTKYVLGTVERTLSAQVRNVEGNVRTGSDNFIKELNNKIKPAEIRRLWS